MARLKGAQAKEDRQQGRSEGDERKSPKGGPRFKREFGEPKDCQQMNFTDPESRIMKTSAQGFQQCYNTQIAVEEGCQLILANGVTPSAADNGELLPLIERTEVVTGSPLQRVLADSGYRSEENFKKLEEKKIDGYVALGREGKKALPQEPDSKNPASRRMCEKLQSEEGQVYYRRRKAIVEPVAGWIKEILGFRRFSLRGLEPVQGEWNLVCAAVNLKRLHAQMCWI